MDKFSKDEMMLMSDGLLKLIGDANEAVKLVDDPATHKAINGIIINTTRDCLIKK